MVNTAQFADAVGRKQIADAVGVQLTAVSNAVVRGRFPATWFSACEVLAYQAGVEFPRGLFGQKNNIPQTVDSMGEVQPQLSKSGKRDATARGLEQ